MVNALKRMVEKGLDMVAMRVEKVKEDGTIAKELTLPYGPEEVLPGVRLQEEHPFWCSAVWGYIYSRAFIESVNYPFTEGVFYEDSDFVCSCLKRAEKVSYSDECAYRAFSNPSGITSTFSTEAVFCYAYLGVRMLALYEGLDNRATVFAYSILEGGSFNLWKAFKQLLRLGSKSDVRAFYNQLDSRVDRKALKKYRKPANCWTWWTRFGVRHRSGMTILAGAIIGMGIPGLRK